MTYDSAFTPKHADRLTVLELNNDSSKLLTASIDHRIAIYDIDRKTQARKLLDVRTAHDAEIRDAKWFHSSTGTHFTTIGNDLQMRIWSQDTSQAPMSGRRFRTIATIKSDQLVPFASFDTKTIGINTYIVVIDRQGLLSFYEPTNPEEYNDWTLIDQFYVHMPAPGRGDHTSFRVRCDPNPIPLPYQASLSDDAEQLTIAVTVFDEIKIYRSTSDSDAITTRVSGLQQSSVGRGASHRLHLFEVLSFNPFAGQPETSAGSLLRDVALSVGNFRGIELLAVASINGSVAMYEILVQPKQPIGTQSIPNNNTKHTQRITGQAQQSNLTSALHSTTSNTNTSQQPQPRDNHPFTYTHIARPVSVFPFAHLDAWSVRWDASGQVLLSSGIDGSVKMWKRAVGATGPGDFELVAEQSGETDDDSEAENTEQDDAGD